MIIDRWSRRGIVVSIICASTVMRGSGAEDPKRGLVQALKTPNGLSNFYLKTFNAPPYLNAAYANNDNSKLSFGLADFVWFYVEMHRLTSDVNWLDLAMATAEAIISRNDEGRVAIGEIRLNGTVPGVDRYWQAPWPYYEAAVPVPGWSAANATPTGRKLRVQILTDGQITWALSAAADYIISLGIERLTPRALAILAHCSRVLHSHDHSWREGVRSNSGGGIDIAGNWFYPKRGSNSWEIYAKALPFNRISPIATLPSSFLEMIASAVAIYRR